MEIIELVLLVCFFALNAFSFFGASRLEDASYKRTSRDVRFNRTI
jgi:hypothetical protein